MLGRPLGTLGMLLLLTLSGCAGGNSATPAAANLPSSVILAGAEDAGGGHIEGSVVDDAVQPVPGAQVALLQTEFVATSDAQGAFAFRHLPAGSYKIAAVALGYSSTARSVEVLEGETANVLLTIVPVAIKEPWVEVLGPLPGFANCVFGTPIVAGVCPGMSSAPNEKSDFRYKMHEDTENLVGELDWTQATAGTSRMMGLTFSYVGRPSSHWWCFGSGASPIKWQYVIEDDECITTGKYTQQGTGGKPPAADQELESFVSIPFTDVGSTSDPLPAHVAIQQKFQVVFSLFQSGAPPEEYSALPDA